jgi:Uri superfamily endonuclease
MKGTYCLIINVGTDFESRIGSLGKLKFEKGCYVYVGSALNNLEKRIARHLRRRKQKHWHIDYMLANKNSAIQQVFFRESRTKKECQIARKIATYGTGIRNFGSSDCGCESHLFRIARPEIKWIEIGMKSCNLMKPKRGFCS